MAGLIRKDSQSTLLAAAFPVELQTKELTADGEFEGYASTFGNRDGDGDVVMVGAFQDTLMRRPAGRVKMLRDHDMRKLIGVWSEAREDARGLWMKGRLILGTEGGREAYELMKAGALDSLSIGYRVLGEVYDRDGDRPVRRLTKLDLVEVSVVAVPANEQAMIARVKAGDMPTERELEAVLRDAGLSASQAKALIAGRGYKSIRDARDAGTVDRGEEDDPLAKLARAIRGLA